MRLKSTSAALLAAVALALGAAAPASAAPTTRPLAVPEGVRLSYPISFTLDGRVVGAAGQYAGYSPPVVWSRTGAVAPLGPVVPTDASVWVEGANFQGDAAGSSYLFDPERGRAHAVLWRGGRLIDLHGATGCDQSQGRGVGPRGEVLISCVNPDYTYKHVLWENGRVRVLFDGRYDVAQIGEGGHVVTSSEEDTGDTSRRSVHVWKDGRTTSTALPTGAFWRLADVGLTGIVVGASGPQPYDHTPTVIRGGTATRLAVPAGYDGADISYSARPQLVNGVGDVVGLARVGLVSRPVLWPRGGAPVVLDPASTGGQGLAVNEFGVVAGDTGVAGGERRAFLWSSGRLTLLPTDPTRAAAATVLHPLLPKAAGYTYTVNGDRIPFAQA